MSMKKLNNKTVVVECKFKDLLFTKEFTIDSNIFDDILLEATTQFVEQYIKEKNNKIPPILVAYNKKDKKDYNKHYCYNSYYILINAGFHKKAEIVRLNFKKATNPPIDLKLESIKSNE